LLRKLKKEIVFLVTYKCKKKMEEFFPNPLKKVEKIY